MDLYTKEKKNLLIIDANARNRNELRSLLSDEYDIMEAHNSDEAQTFLKSSKAVCVMLMSAEILRTDADSFLKLMQGSTEFSIVPILIIADENSSPEDFLLLGRLAFDCIEKPYNSYIIKNRISNAILLKDSMTMYGIEKMLKELPSNIYLKDREGRYVFATHYWHHLEHNNDPNWTIRGKTDLEIRKDKENALAAEKKDRELVATGQGTSYTIEINTDGIQEFFEIIKQPVFNDDGNVSGIIGLINNVTEHELLKRELERRTRTDMLTGIFNRAYLYEYMEKIQREGSYPISIISADCDGLKTINDTYGHMAGDEYIRMAVQLFQTVLPKESALFRTGGDEFVLILPSTSRETATDYIAQMKDKEKQLLVREISLSVSFGISCLDTSDDSVEKCIVESDKNMYYNKNKTYAEHNNMPRNSWT